MVTSTGAYDGPSGLAAPVARAMTRPYRAALVLAPPLVMVSRALRPVIAALNWMANLVLRLFRVEPKDEATSTFLLEQVAGIVEQSQRDGLLVDHLGTLTGAFEFTDKTVGELEVPMEEVVTPPDIGTPADVQRAVIEHGNSRYVVTDRTGTPIGCLHMRDVTDLGLDESTPGSRTSGSVVCLPSLARHHSRTPWRTCGITEPTPPQQSVVAGTPSGVFLEDVIDVLVARPATWRDTSADGTTHVGRGR